ncbi:MAG: hypothetical protein HYW02_05890 [Deltaproteobacteria bacterium]|nr:hypothetical protein [Deltaproteobacteria bacterium]
MALTPIQSDVCHCIPVLCQNIDQSKYGNKNGIPEMEDLPHDPNDPEALQRLIGSYGLECLNPGQGYQDRIKRPVTFSLIGGFLAGDVGFTLGRGTLGGVLLGSTIGFCLGVFTDSK